MSDPLRIALFALSLVALSFSSTVVASQLRLGAVGSVLALWVVASAQIVGIAQILSLLHALDWPGFFVGHALVAGATALWLRLRPGSDPWQAVRAVWAGARQMSRGAIDWRTPAVPVIAGAVLAIGATCTFVALAVPPNNSDSLAYHLSRVGFYLQFGSFDVYPTMIPRQVFYPANAEILILWSVSFLRSDRLANLPQLLAWGVTVVAAYGLGRLAGFGRGAVLFGAGLFATLPQSVLQTGSAHNDLVVTSYLAICLYFLLAAARTPRPTTPIVLAGAAGGLMLGTKGTALLAGPMLLLAFALLFGRQFGRRLLPGLLAGCLAGLLLGSYFYVQNWWVYGAVIGPVGGRLANASAAPDATATIRDGFLANLGRTLWTGAFADLSGPLAHRAAGPVAVPLIAGLTAAGEGTFGALGIPRSVPGLDDPGAPTFTFAKDRAVHDYSSGIGFVGGAILLAAFVVVVWPRRLPHARRILGVSALAYLAALWLLVPFHPFTAGRFLLTAAAIAAPLLGVFLRPGRWWQALALTLALWSGATGLYVAWFNQHRPAALLARPGWLAERDWLARLMLPIPGYELVFREMELEAGPDTALAVTVAQWPGGYADYTEYQFFGPRLERTVVPLTHPSYLDRFGPRRSLSWTNDDLFARYRPGYLAVAGVRSPADALPPGVAARCYPLPLTYTRPPISWRLLRCDDSDPRNRLVNGDLTGWRGGRGTFFAGSPGPPVVGSADAWQATAAGGARLAVSQLDAPPPDAEPFRMLLRYRPGSGSDGAGALVQEVPLDGLPVGSWVVVDARIWATAAGAVTLRLDDGASTTAATNLSADPETLRVRYQIGAGARVLRVSLVLAGQDGETEVRVRSILAIPRAVAEPAVRPFR